MLYKFIRITLLITAVYSLGKVDPPTPKYKYIPPVITEVASTPVCPDGTKYTVEGCSRVFTTQPKLQCPHPYKFDADEKCVYRMYGSSSLNCGTNMYLEGKYCITEKTTPASVLCRQGEVTEKGCLVTAEPVVVKDEIVPTDLKCPIGYHLDNDTCILAKYSNTEKVCSEGFVVKNGKCYSVETSAFKCKEGYTFIGMNCVATESTPPIYVCPKSSIVDEKGACLQRKEEAPTLYCEKGYDLNGRSCEATVLIQAVIQGAKSSVIDIPFDCKKGSVGVDGHCYQVHRTEPTLVCGDNYELNGQICVSLVPIDPLFDCPKGFDATTTLECVRNLKAKPFCPLGFTFGKESCEKITIENPVLACPQGQTLDKTKCIAIVTVAPTASCKKGFELSDTKCVKPGYVKAGVDKLYAPFYECPKGYDYSETNNICIQYVKSDPTVVCEKGYTLENNKCIALHTVDPQLICPKGYAQNSTGACAKTVYDRPIFICPEGSEDHGSKCYVFPADYKRKRN